MDAVFKLRVIFNPEEKLMIKMKIIIHVIVNTGGLAYPKEHLEMFCKLSNLGNHHCKSPEFMKQRI